MSKQKKKHPTQKTTSQRVARRTRKMGSQASPGVRPPAPSRPSHPGPASHRDMEKVNRAVTRILDAKAAECEAAGRDPDAEIKEVMKSITGKSFDEIIALAGEPTAEERAQDIVDQAVDEEDLDKIRHLAAQALEIDPFCMDALYIEALEDGEHTEALAERIRGAMKKWENHKGAEYFETHRGHFWAFPETRPYMRALASLAELLRALKSVDEAIAIYDRCLELNNSDNLGMRYALLGLYLQEKNMAGARKLFKRFSQDASAVFAWGKVLYHYLILDRTEAGKALFAAMEVNPYFLPILLSPNQLTDRLNSYTQGDESEAAFCVLHLGAAWLEHSMALEWAVTQLHEAMQTKQPKRRR